MCILRRRSLLSFALRNLKIAIPQRFLKPPPFAGHCPQCCGSQGTGEAELSPGALILVNASSVAQNFSFLEFSMLQGLCISTAEKSWSVLGWEEVHLVNKETQTSTTECSTLVTSLSRMKEASLSILRTKKDGIRGELPWGTLP